MSGYRCRDCTAARSDLMVKFIAGGQSLGPCSTFGSHSRCAGRSDRHRRVDAGRGGESAPSIGACVTHADIEDGRVPDLAGGMLRSVARGIAYRAVRNRGTIGGGVAHADPSADWISCLAALGASGRARRIRATLGADRGVHAQVSETTLLSGELVEAVTVPRLSNQAEVGIL